jgi:PAS domain S-box-containing protein
VVPDAIVGVKANGRIALMNAQAERLFGYPRDELLGKPVETLIPKGLRSIHARHRAGYVTDPRRRPIGVGMQLVARRKDGTEFPAEISLGALETEEGMIVSAAVRDVTDRLEERAERERLRTEAERERLESQLQQSQRLESLGQLAGGVAHDFNNLLAVILNYAAFVGEEIERASHELGGRRWEAVGRDVDQIQRAAERATRLTHQLLAFGRREVVSPRVISLNDVIGDVDELLRRTLGEHIELIIALGDDLWPILADPGQIEQILLNLVVNARDAMPDAGVLTIDTQNTDVDEAFTATRPGIPTGRFVQMRVSDTGVGMAADVLDRAFEPFFTTKAKGEGSGLGLPTVYGIITQAGGYAQLVSEAGSGTTFSALLPATEEAVVHDADRAAPASVGGGETILLVEDEGALLEVMRRILVRNGYQVLAASSGREALAVARQRTGGIEILVTDVVMPQMQGKEVADALTKLRPSIRVLYVSGYARPLVASRGTLEEGVALLEKPFSEATLLAKVREVLGA